ncbi:MAG: hypothetical protein V1704_05005 [Candidatus Vogelbacteria bacterium]
MKQCYICEKGSRMAGGYSNRVRATKFNPTGMVRKYPNLQWASLPTGGRAKLCTRCLKKSRHLVG